MFMARPINYYNEQTKKKYAVFIDDDLIYDGDNAEDVFKKAELSISKRCDIVVLSESFVSYINNNINPNEQKTIIRGMGKGIAGWLVQFSYKLVEKNLFRCQNEGLTVAESVIYIVRKYTESLHQDGHKICETILNTSFTPQYYSKTYSKASAKIIASGIEDLIDFEL